MQINSAEEYAIALLGLLGEIPSMAIADMNGLYTGKYLKNTFFKLAEEGVVKKIRANGKLYFRLKVPKGTDMLKELSKKLYRHYVIMTAVNLDGPPRYVTGDKLLRLRHQIKLLMYLYDAGISINCFSFEKEADKKEGALREKTVFGEAGNVLRYTQIQERLEEDDVVFITSQVLSERGNITSHAKDINSRKMGLLKGEEDSFLVYMVNSPEYKWIRETEQNNRERFKKDTKNDIKGLFIAKNEEVYEKVLKPEKIISSICQPLSVFEEANVLMAGEDLSMALKILTKGDLKEKLNSIILEKAEGYFDIKPDGLINGEPVFNFLLGDLKRLKDAKECIRFKHTGKILLCSYQVKPVLNYLGYKESRINDLFIVLPDGVLSSLQGKLLGKE